MSLYQPLVGLPRGINQPEETIPGVGAAAQLLAQRLKDRETVAVYADYDVDGTASASIMRLVLGPYQEQIIWGYPDASRGTGLDSEWIKRAARAGAKSLVSLDLGSGQPGAVTLANRLGLDTIISDHHHPHPDLEAHFHLNPQLHSPGDQASRANVAFKLALELSHALNGQADQELIDRGAWLAGLAARADLMDLDTNENQALVRAAKDPQSAPPGLQALAKELGLASLAPSNQSKMIALLNLPKRTPLAQAQWSAAILSAPDAQSAKPWIKKLLRVRGRCQEVQGQYLGLAWAEHAENQGHHIALAQIQAEDSHLFAGYAGLIALQYARSSGHPAAVFIPQDENRSRYKWSLRTGTSPVGESGALALRQHLPASSNLAGGHAQAMGGICQADDLGAVQEAMRKWAKSLDLPTIQIPAQTVE